MSDFGMVEASRDADGTVHVHRADDVIEVAGELAEQYGVRPPLDGRIQLTDDLSYDLTAWSFANLPGRTPGTYIGRKVQP